MGLIDQLQVLARASDFDVWSRNPQEPGAWNHLIEVRDSVFQVRENTTMAEGAAVAQNGGAAEAHSTC
jgi:hypothetical protein